MIGTKRIFSSYIRSLVQTYEESQVVTIDAFGLRVISSFVEYIEHGKIITPEYLQT